MKLFLHLFKNNVVFYLLCGEPKYRLRQTRTKELMIQLTLDRFKNSICIPLIFNELKTSYKGKITWKKKTVTQSLSQSQTYLKPFTE